jgi:hypothetical protein
MLPLPWVCGPTDRTPRLLARLFPRYFAKDHQETYRASEMRFDSSRPSEEATLPQ